MGLRTDGIRTITDLRSRCRVDEGASVGEKCWHWGYGASGDGRPSMWLPVLRKRVSLATAACVLRTGKPPERGVVWHCTCSTKHCANPFHREPGTRSAQMLAAGIRRDASVRARISATKRAKSALSDAACDDIRTSTEPLRIVAERHGISISHASNVRRGEQRLPLAVRGSSVFNLGSGK